MAGIGPRKLGSPVKMHCTSPAKKTGPGDKKKNIQKGTVNAARQILKDSTSINNPNLSDAEVIRAAKAKGVYQEASSRAKRAAAGGSANYDYDSPAKRKDACYNKVKARYDVFPSAYASGAIAKCRKVGAANWGNKSKK